MKPLRKDFVCRLEPTGKESNVGLVLDETQVISKSLSSNPSLINGINSKIFPK